MSTKPTNENIATGKRKSAVARVRLSPGNGDIVVNKKALEEYFGPKTIPFSVRRPFVVTNTENKFDVRVNVVGGGSTGQAEAIRHGIARALVEWSGELRKPLKQAGLLTRDSRIVERKKYGRKKARKRFQFSKR